MVLASEFIHKIKRRIIWMIKGRPIPPNLLEMVWSSSSQLGPLPEVEVAEGYRIRQFDALDTPNYYALFQAAEMGQPPLYYWDKHILENGFFVIEETSSQALVAACFASHHPAERHPRAGNLGWLAVHPAHRGHGLGRAVALAVTRRLIDGGYKRLYLETHDHRLPAIAIYLKMGWRPWLYLPEMAARWDAVCNQLGWLYDPFGSEDSGFYAKQELQREEVL